MRAPPRITTGLMGMRVAAVRAFAHRFALLLFLGAALLLMVVNHSRPDYVNHIRASVTDFTAPVLDFLSRPVEVAGRWVGAVRMMMSLYEDNVRLQQENARLLEWRTAARRIHAENRALRALLAYDRQDAMRFVTGRVVGSGSRFMHSVVLNVGADKGVRQGQTAVVGEGLVGRVLSVGEHSARILLITDLNSRIPVIVESTRVRAILAGDNGPQPHLLHLAAGSIVRPGQRIVTSGHGGVFPPGLPVGVVASVNESGVRVQPYATLDRQEYIRLMDFGLKGTLEIARGTESSAAP